MSLSGQLLVAVRRARGNARFGEGLGFRLRPIDGMQICPRTLMSFQVPADLADPLAGSLRELSLRLTALIGRAPFLKAPLRDSFALG